MPDTLSIDATSWALAVQPTAPVRVEGACPFEGCTYGTWTTSAETAVYAWPSARAEPFTVSAGTALTADRGFVLVKALGLAVAQRDAVLYVSAGGTVPVAAGDTVRVMDAEGEGSFRAWSRGRIGVTGSDGFDAPPGGTTPLREVSAPQTEWWAHVTLPDGRSGWLWMDETPPVDGADALG